MSPIQISDQMKQFSHFRPSSVPINLDITSVRSGHGKDQSSDLANMSEQSLDRLKRDLSIMVEATMNATSDNQKENNKKKTAKKKISLPNKLSDERLTSTLPSDAKNKVERKRSVDSSLNIISPTLSMSPDMKFYFKEKLKTNLRMDAKQKSKSKDKSKQSEARFQKGHSGYSHLECCSNIPYNLEEEPEVVDGMKNPRSRGDDIDLSFTSRSLQQEDCNQTGNILDHYHSSGAALETLDEDEDVLIPTINISSSPAKSLGCELQGMDKVRDIVLNSSKKKTADDEDSDSSLSEASGWVSNNSRRSSLSTTDTNSENHPKERSKSFIESRSQSKYSSAKPRESDLKSPGLILSKGCRSRSEEPADKMFSPIFSNRPRHRSECGTHR